MADTTDYRNCCGYAGYWPNEETCFIRVCYDWNQTSAYSFSWLACIYCLPIIYFMTGQDEISMCRRDLVVIVGCYNGLHACPHPSSRQRPLTASAMPHAIVPLLLQYVGLLNPST